MSPLLNIQALSLQAGERRLLEALDWQVSPGQCWVILGRNGSGKSRLLSALAGLQDPHAGNIEHAGQPIQQLDYGQRAHRFGLLFQHSERGLHGNVREMVLGGSQDGSYWPSADQRQLAEKNLARVALEALAEQSVQHLSGGELRRAEIARLLMQNPALAMLDEPTNHLDISQQASMLHLLKTHFVNSQQALIMVLHNLQLASRFATHLLLLEGNGDWEAGPVASLATPQRLSRALGHPVRLIEVEGQPLWFLE